MARPTGRDLRTEVMDLACQAIQRSGVSAFSFGTIARELGVAAPTLHHHFRTKAQLIEAVTERYRADFVHRRDTIDAETPTGRLAAFASMFAEPASEDLVCLCAAVAGAGRDAPVAAQVVIADFFDEQLDWVRHTADEAITAGEFGASVDSSSFAEGFVAALEGALLLARAGVGSRSVDRIGGALIDLARPR